MKRLQVKKLGAIIAVALILAVSGCDRIQVPEEIVLDSQISNEPGVTMRSISPYSPYYQETYPGTPEQKPLYYRMRDEDFLVRKMSNVDLLRGKSLQESLIQELIKGPSTDTMELTGVFIADTKILDVVSEGDTLLVTLSHHFLETPADMPENWEDIPARKAEVLLRRRLALASIVSTVTEETSYTAVQLYVAVDEKDTAGRRMVRSEIFEDEPGDVLLAPMMRNEEDVLTHYSAANIILGSIQSKNFDRLYRFVSGSPAESAFLEEMIDSNTLTAYSISTGMVSNDGQNAILIADLTFANANGLLSEQKFTFRIEQEDCLWKIKYETLKKMMEAT